MFFSARLCPSAIVLAQQKQPAAEEITGGGGGGGSSDISASTPLITSYLSSHLGVIQGLLNQQPC
jgi:hypothetical protein